MVRVVIESELVRTEKELPNSLKLKQFKDRLYHVTGVEPEDMEIVVKRQYDNKEIYSTKKGGAYSNEDEDANFLKGEEELMWLLQTLMPNQSLTSWPRKRKESPQWK